MIVIRSYAYTHTYTRKHTKKLTTCHYPNNIIELADKIMLTCVSTIIIYWILSIASVLSNSRLFRELEKAQISTVPVTMASVTDSRFF